jgi:hypothetical protein
MRPRQSRRAQRTISCWPPWRPPSHASRPRSRQASPRRPSRSPAWRTCACARPRCAPWAAGAGGARRSRRPCCRACSAAGHGPAVAGAPPLERAGGAQVPEPVRRVGGGPTDAAVLRLQRRALLLGRVPEGGLARRPQGRVPAPATSARLSARQPLVLGFPAAPFACRPCKLYQAGRYVLCARLGLFSMHHWAGAQRLTPWS